MDTFVTRNAKVGDSVPVAKKTADPPKNQPKRKLKISINLTILHYITFSHLADGFIQSDVQGTF